MIFCDPDTCLHLHLICTECDFSEGHCHCNDGGDWFCQDCNRMEYERKSIRDAVELRNPYTWYKHDRKLPITNTMKGNVK